MPFTNFMQETDLKESPYAPAATISATVVAAPAPANFQGGVGGVPLNFPYQSLPRAVNGLSIALIVMYPIMVSACVKAQTIPYVVYPSSSFLLECIFLRNWCRFSSA